MKSLLIPLLFCLFSGLVTAREIENRVLPSQVQISEIRTTGLENYEYDFGDVAIGTEADAYFAITNTTKKPLIFKDAVIEGDYFYAEHTCTGGLQPGEECYVGIYYYPEASGEHTGALEISFDPDLVLHVDLFGNAY